MNANKVGYPRIVRSDGLPVQGYEGILFSGDCAVYKKAVIKELKKEGVSQPIIKEVKKLHYDLEISEYLINNHLMNVLVTVYSVSDAETAMNDYIENVYLIDETRFNDFPLKELIKKYLDGTNELSQQEADDILQKIDSEIINFVDNIISELEDFHNGREQELREEFRKAQLRHIDAI